ncbi:MAG: ABC transporter substrate-binding protein [Arthrobacter sp.]|uniref:ABC transporter substrate-binding protein n=1 Tax=unclassified Arthrobacter TaxID=235627 RepID=UPI0026525A5A|nr:ABC transporter substrate-binding protein [Micrococcaceae bacterium]MDN5812095.1 ABC transporter substrate-binding protein [Micrococcaceae bacterium]MDN5880337.1 ABC transporter substrate-binding protein [Micrococcaceae bacterium]MDN5887518.1 ABC transporter substrate-binding protein [Micrococcaceae bacterium]MDN5906076.1 ABC transporter substrate-binding protein [Micrococcaceae bacterium]
MRIHRAGKLAAGLMATALLATACGSTGDEGAGGADGEIEPVKIGMSQIQSHPSLDAVVKGFKKGMEDAGYTGDKVSYDFQNPQGDQSTNTAIMNQFAGDDLDLVLAVATPTAQAAAQAINDVPILFSAVTDAEEAKLVSSNEAPGANVTGTSNRGPIKEQLELLKKLDPEAETVGIVYSSGEVNSTIQVEWVKEAAAELDLKVKESSISASSEVQQAAASLDVDAFYVPNDNAVVSALEGLLQAAQSKKVPVVTADGASVKRGATVAYGIDYEKLGVQTAEMAVRILQDGDDPAEMPVETLEDVDLYVNTAAAEKAGVEIPQEMLDEAAEVYEK